MQFRDLAQQYQHLKPKIDAAIQQVCGDANFISGSQVQKLEAILAEYVGVKHCITCANGTDALTLILMAWGVGVGDAVFVPDFTFFASGETVSYEGATPIFVDVCQDTFNLDPIALEKAILKVLDEGKFVPKAIIAVDLFGLPADYPTISAVAKKYGLLLLEDGAQGFGGSIGQKRVCSFADASATSFFPAKPLGCYGDGGAIFTNDDVLEELIRSYAVHGKGSMKYDNIRIGINSRLDTLQAAILLVKFEALVEYELKQVNDAAVTYTQLLDDIVICPKVPSNFYSSWAQYTIRLNSLEQRNHLQQGLKQAGIPSMVYYPKPMHLQQAFSGTRSALADCPITETLCDTVLSLPMHPYLNKELQQKIVQALKSCI